MTLRWRILAIAALALILAGTFQPFYLRIFASDRDATRAWLVEVPYRKTPGLRSLLDEARRLTTAEDVVAFVAPYRRWEGGYRYALRGAKYELAGRTVLPTIGRGDADLSANVARADVVVAYGATAPPAGWRVVSRGEAGLVARRIE